MWLQVIKKNRILYQAEVDDPLFAAHRKVEFLDASTEENTTVYISDMPASVLGCSSQVSLFDRVPVYGEIINVNS